MKTYIYTIITVLVLAVVGFGQDKAQRNQWKGLILDEASPEKAVEVLGKPKTDKPNQSFRPLKFNEWFDVKAKDFRLLHYEDSAGVEGFKDVTLIFRKDKLVAITLEPKKLEANALPRSYEGNFVYLSDKLARAFNPQDFERDRGQDFPKNYPDIYYLMNEAEKSYVFAMVTNTSFGSILSKSMGGQDSSESIPGKAAVIQLITKSLIETKSTDLLK